MLYSLLNWLRKDRHITLIHHEDEAHVYQLSRPYHVKGLGESLAWKTLKLVTKDRDSRYYARKAEGSV